MIIRHGTIATASDTFKADIGIKNGKIVAIAKDLQWPGAEEVDASGKWVLPGGVDVHTHLEMPFGGTVSSDDYFAGTRAAACGGVTTVFDFVIQRKGQGIVEAVQGRRALCEPKAAVDYAFHVALTDLTGQVLAEFPRAAEYGVPSFKLFMVYKKEGLMMDDAALITALEKGKEHGISISVHAENPEAIDLLIGRFLAEGKTSAKYHYESRPEWVEAEADIRAIHWAKSLRAPLYIVHLANKEGMDEVTRAHDEGYEIYAETCPQYLQFTKEVYDRPDGRNFVCSPPIKGQESQDALWAGIFRGDIATVATDHCPFQSTEKDWGKDDFTKIPNGCMGTENLYPFMFSEGFMKRGLSINRVVELVSANPAKLFGCYPQKGTIAVGSDADIVIFDPDLNVRITQELMHSDCDYTIWEGVELRGYPILTFSRGRKVFDHGTFVGERGWGKFVKRHPRLPKGTVVRPEPAK
jgi:dihydropyrimidinase